MSPPGPVSDAACRTQASKGNRMRVGALADNVSRHEVVPGLASQASYLSVFLLPSQSAESARAHDQPRGQEDPECLIKLDLNLLDYTCNPEIGRWDHLAVPTTRCVWCTEVGLVRDR